FILDMAKRVGWWALIAVGLLWFRKQARALFRSLKAILPPPPPKMEPSKMAQAIVDELPRVVPERRKPKLLDQMQETAKDRPDELAKVIKTMMVGNSD
ncbi:MAG TPA: hypothetical protein VLB27_10660, partial [candidate division Zixibacteria bacterium]|nr:hypothetical protein [candidate division Zixibacteria bacterium]